MPRGIGYGGRGSRMNRARRKAGRVTTPRGTRRTRTNKTGNLRSTRMSRGRGTTSRLLANPNNNRIVSQNPNRARSIRGRGTISAQAGNRPAKVPANFREMRVERTEFASKGKGRYRTMWCPPGTTTLTNECMESTSPSQTSYIAGTSNIRRTRNTRGVTRKRR